ncbi:hypothetical protein [Frankia sp. Cj3]|uniref:hypothetical protein n=1 Tax=Frankia sp. Cj3 TaxID=2880976 RepID=UPI001EF4731A|nr:hypothetical protein [Frankia sp. Cj3]
MKYSTQLPPALIKWVKRHALDHDTKDYEVVRAAVELLKAAEEQRTPQAVELLPV